MTITQTLAIITVFAVPLTGYFETRQNVICVLLKGENLMRKWGLLLGE